MILVVIAVAAAIVLSAPSGAQEMIKRVLIFGDSNSWGAAGCRLVSLLAAAFDSAERGIKGTVNL